MTAARVPDNQPPADKIPTVRRSQTVRNMKSTPSKSRYALATRVITTINILIHYETNTLIDLITGTAEKYPALLCGPNSEIWKNHSQMTWVG